jgi:hypothetical protein
VAKIAVKIVAEIAEKIAAESRPDIAKLAIGAAGGAGLYSLPRVSSVVS